MAAFRSLARKGGLFVAASIALTACDWPHQYPPRGAWGRGPGMMDGYGPGYGPMMGPAYAGCWGSPMMGAWGQRYGQQPASLSTADVKAGLDRWVAWTGNPHIKVGPVIQKDADTITADIVTQDNSLVQRLAFDRRTGGYHPVQESASLAGK